jgi:hypothetical protein
MWISALHGSSRVLPSTPTGLHNVSTELTMALFSLKALSSKVDLITKVVLRGQ